MGLRNKYQWCYMFVSNKEYNLDTNSVLSVSDDALETGGRMKKMNLKMVGRDALLEPYEYIISKRHESFVLKLLEFTDGKRRLSDVFNTHLYYGMHHSDEGWTFREWAPQATAIYLVGDFCDWRKCEDYRLENIGSGSWELKMAEGMLEHGALYRLQMEWQGGEASRLPSHVRRVVQDEDTKVFSAQVWEDKPYIWKNPQPTRVKNPLIYEAHIGMATEYRRVSTFDEFRLYVLPRIVDLGYNTIQLMGIQEHPYYGSFGYQVANFFAVSSRFGTPEELKHLIDEAHGYGISVVMDLVHSHAVKNEAEGLSRFDGSYNQFFHSGEAGEHRLWDSRCFDYGKNEVISFLLSNCKYWLTEFQFDGFRFDGVTSMIFRDHGLERDFTDYKFYYDGNQDEDAIVYLQLANRLIHEVNPCAMSIAEDMSGMPGIALPIADGGIGFDFRLSMGTPDYWIRLIEEKRDEEWHVGDLFYELTNRRRDERSISYAESHDQAMVGDKTLIFRLMGKEMYSSMSVFGRNLVVDRGMALHKMIRLLTIATAGDGYLCFMGNEWGHPEWIDFPRVGNDWSYDYARRQWSLVDDTNLRYRFLNSFDKAMIELTGEEHFFDAIPEPLVRDVEKQVLIFRRGALVFVFNFNPEHSFSDYRLEIEPGLYVPVLDSDSACFDGFSRIDSEVEHFTLCEEGRHLLSLYLPARTVFVLRRRV